MSVNYDNMTLPEILITKLANYTNEKLNKTKAGNLSVRDNIVTRINIILNSKLPLNNSGPPVNFKTGANRDIFKYIGLEYNNLNDYDYNGILLLLNNVYNQIKDRKSNQGVDLEELDLFKKKIRGSSFDIINDQIKYKPYVKVNKSTTPEQRDPFNNKRILYKATEKQWYSLGGSNEHYEL
jgi:hypothetical protein